MFGFETDDFKSMSFRHKLSQFFATMYVGVTALAFWKLLIILTSAFSPIVVCTSGSMEPAFYRGDLLFVSKPDILDIKAGDIIVMQLKIREIPVVHRALYVHRSKNASYNYILSKGDNNNVDDRGLYQTSMYVGNEHLLGVIRGTIPYIGYVTIALTDYPPLKFLFVAFLLITTFIKRE